MTNVIYLNEDKQSPGCNCPECNGELNQPTISEHRGDFSLVEAIEWTCKDCGTIYFQTYRYLGDDLRKRLDEYKQAANFG